MIAVLTNHVWQSTLFAVAAWLVTLALRRNRAQVRYCVWLAASLKFLLPFSLLVSLGDRIEWRTAAPEPQFAIAIERFSQPFTPSAPAFTGTPKNAEVLPAALIAVWGCGFVAAVFLFGRRWTRINADAKCARAVGIEAPIPVKCSRGLVEPGVFGLLRPVLLLPEGIVERLTPAQLDAILAHEMCHVRRRDNVWAAVHMIVEAAFWFHPFAWWIGARLIEERERACDEEVLAMGGGPQAYAEGILKVCEFYVESPLVCLSGVTGSDLKKRIEAIMANRAAADLDLAKKALLGLASMASLAGPFIVGLLNAPATSAQPQAAALYFETASIRQNKSGEFGSGLGFSPGGGFRASNSTLEDLIWFAYQSSYFHKGLVSGVPAWVRSERFDIVAKAEGSATPNQLKLMLRSLLADRFQLKVHEETRQLPIYGLVVARSDGKTGAQMRRTPPEEVAYCEARADQPEYNRDGSKRCGSSSRRGLQFRARPVSDLVEYLEELVDRVVVDRTRLEGRFDIDVDAELNWDSVLHPEETGGADVNRAIFPVLQEQLGLKLESTRGPVRIMVIDSVQMPSEN